jgi:hypothetical protein
MQFSCSLFGGRQWLVRKERIATKKEKILQASEAQRIFFRKSGYRSKILLAQSPMSIIRGYF